MFISIDQLGLAGRPLLRRTMLLDRASQFVDRHGWPLSLDDRGGEIDEFDDEWTTYCLIADGERHLASVRLRPSSAGSMLNRHFGQFKSRSRCSVRAGFEVTRFCSSPSLSAVDGSLIVSDLLIGLCRHCQRHSINSFFGVVFPAVYRVIRASGWAGEPMEEALIEGEKAILAVWKADELTSWRLQEVRTRRADRSTRPKRDAIFRKVA